MIPGLLATEVAAALREFIVTGFETETAPFKGEFRRLVEEQQDGEAFLKGPYVSVGLPFLIGSAGRDFFSSFATEHPPYAHQELAWQRLASDRRAANTLVATGTGSGKTECFMYPVLDHCQRAAEPGIKAIVIYPMNALATDQAKRFAAEIHRQPALKGLRVGLSDDEWMSKWNHAWVLKNVEALPEPVSYNHPSGAVTWVNIGKQD